LRTRTFLRLCSVTALAAAILLASAGIALAAPGEPTMGLEALQAKLDASPSGTVSGYFLTVVKGSAIETIPVEILALTGDVNDPDNLIMFEAQGAKIEKWGGIVAGMSGSPIYVDDEGTPTVVGAVSYGDAFTLSGTGLATPIDSMRLLLTDYTPVVESLPNPVLISGRVIDKVIVSSHPQTLKSASKAGALVARPLSSVYLGGLRPSTRLYKNLKKRLESQGMSVVQIDTALSAGASTFSTDLVPGSAVAALASRGDLWMGGIGTVTYTDGGNLLAFGHPAWWTGESSMYMANAYISGVWPNSYFPYKIGYPATIQGTFTQDRMAGIMGTVGAPPAETPITAHAVNVDNDREASSAVYMSSEMLDRGDLTWEVSYAASIAGAKLFDQYATPGSALTTTTIVVSDGETQYVVTMTNMVDDYYDVPSAVAYDVDNAIYSLLSVLDEGLEEPHIVSVDLQSEISTHRRNARIVSVKPEEALKIGDNRIDVEVLAYGVAATQTIETTLTLPEGTPLMGTLSASSYFSWDSFYSDMYEDYLYGIVYSFDDEEEEAFTRETIAGVVEDLNEAAPGNTLFVRYEPDPSMIEFAEDEEEPSLPSLETTPSFDTSTTTDWVMQGSAELLSPAIIAEAYPNPAAFYGYSMIGGELYGPEEDTTVYIYATPYGGVEELVTTETATYDDEIGELTYFAFLDGLTANTTVRVHTEGTKNLAPADAFVEVGVRAHVFVSASSKSVTAGKTVKLKASVEQESVTTGTVSFQYYDTRTRKWKTISTQTLVAGSPGYITASANWKVLKGSHKVRALFNGNEINVATASGSVTITGR